MKSTFFKNTVQLLLYLAFFSCINAQQPTDSTSVTSDTVYDQTKLFMEGMKEASKSMAQANLDKFKQGRLAIHQKELLDELNRVIHKAKDYLKRGIDTVGIRNELISSEKWFTKAIEGIFVNHDTVLMNRNLSTSHKLLEVTLKRIEKKKSYLDTYQQNLSIFRDRIDSLASDSAIFKFSSDSLAFWQYFRRLSQISEAITPTDELITKAYTNVNELALSLGDMVIRIGSTMEEIEVLQKKLSDKSFNREFAGMGITTRGKNKEFGSVLNLSLSKELHILQYYISENKVLMALMFILIFAVYIFLRTLKKHSTEEKAIHRKVGKQVALRYPLLTAVLIVFSLYQFVFPNPPFVFYSLIWAFSAITLSVLLWRYISMYWVYVLLTIIFLYIIAAFDNLILQVTAAERWLMLFVSLTGVVSAIYILVSGRRHELKEKKILFFIGLLAVLETLSFLANLTGRYNLSKSLLISGYVNVIVGIVFLWTIRLLNEILLVASTVYRSSEKRSSVINFEKIGSNVPGFVYVLLVAGWLLLFGRNFYAFKFITSPLYDFLFNERKVGNYSFTVGSVLVFFLIMAVAMIASKLVSFFASDSNILKVQGKDRKAGIGSWILLIRITIISLGVFLAFAATGIPMERITIILGALGVGIGMGLQSLVNNLVSGLIIAFEKPFNVGDVVDVAGMSGKVKSIGFRSSVISNFDGADVFIPNGDLLNSHLVNWTISSKSRRTDLLVGVAYGSDLEKVRQIILSILALDNRVKKQPEPVVLFQEFGSSSIDIKIYYWVNQFSDATNSRSDLVAAIKAAFEVNGIEIPYPQQELRIRRDGTEKKDNPLEE